MLIARERHAAFERLSPRGADDVPNQEQC
jgi:hypothetical protein